MVLAELSILERISYSSAKDRDVISSARPNPGATHLPLHGDSSIGEYLPSPRYRTAE